MEFTPKYPLVDSSDPILREETEIFSFMEPPEDPVQFARDLTEHMLHYGGIGLAAPQLGKPYRVFAIRSDPVLVCYNPVMVDASENDQIEMDEGCLTFPNLCFKVRRPRSIKIRYQLPNSEIVTRTYTGMTARVVQHEYDHIEGVLFIDRISKLKLDMALKKSQKYVMEYKPSEIDWDAVKNEIEQANKQPT